MKIKDLSRVTEEIYQFRQLKSQLAQLLSANPGEFTAIDCAGVSSRIQNVPKTAIQEILEGQIAAKKEYLVTLGVEFEPEEPKDDGPIVNPV
jgi:hypothetical protein